MPEDYIPVPVADAAAIARSRRKDIVCVVSIDRRHDRTHMTTFGATPIDKVHAADLGDRVMKCLGSDPTQKRSFEDWRDLEEAARTAMNLRELRTLRPAAEWTKEHGCVIWWRVPSDDPPHIGRADSVNWPEDYYTHWTPLPSPIPCEVGA